MSEFGPIVFPEDGHDRSQFGFPGKSHTDLPLAGL
jgi:hypothetical protein